MKESLKVFVVRIGTYTRRGNFQGAHTRFVWSKTLDLFQVRDRAEKQYRGFGIEVEEITEVVSNAEYIDGLDTDLPF